MMQIFDKVKWHIDGGENAGQVLEKFQAVMEFLKQNELLTEEGVELYNLGVDTSFSIHERMLTDTGIEFLKKHYDSVINLEASVINRHLSELF